MGVLNTAYAVPTAIALFLLTLFLVIRRPWNLEIGWGALIGAGLSLLVGTVSQPNIPEVWAIVWNATLTLVALFLLCLILDAAGLFRWAALHLVRWGQGRGYILFPLVVLLGAGMTALFTNDGTALVLTPIVMELLLALEFSAGATLAFVMATGFIADSSSLPFTISNLTNIITADYFQISFLRYALVMVPVNLVAVLASLAVLWFYFGRRIPRRYPLTSLPSPSQAIRDPLVFRWSGPVLWTLSGSYLLAEPLHLPVSLLVGVAAIALLLIAGRWLPGTRQVPRVLSTAKVIREAPWQIVLFSLGMYLVVFGLRNVGLTHLLSQGLSWLTQWGFTVTTLGVGLGTALLSAVMNNLPTVMINCLSIEAIATLSPKLREGMIYANIIGVDLGPKMTPIGSLATLLWLHILSRRGLRIGWVPYCVMGTVLTIPVLIVTLLSLAVWLPWLIVE